MSDNFLKAEGAKHFAEALGYNNSLRELKCALHQPFAGSPLMSNAINCQ